MSILMASLIANVYLSLMLSGMMAGPTESTYMKGDRSQRIVILPVNGMIDASMSTFVHDCLATLYEQRPKAVILRINSGGGAVSAADRIWHELVAFQKQTEIPIVASFGSVAASGGYYIAAPTDFIVAEPTCITGSIGVIAQAFTVDQLLQKIGVQPELITATEAYKKDMLNPMREWTDRDRIALRSILDHAYLRFVQVVDEGRDQLTFDAVKQLATGEVFTADEAEENQLVDAQGYLDAAIVKAKELGGIDLQTTPQVTILAPPRSLGGLMGVLGRGALPNHNAFEPRQVRDWLGELATPRLEYRWVR